MTQNSSDLTRVSSRGISRRRLLALGGSGLGAPGLARAQPAPVRIGAVGPLTGTLTYNGTQAKAGIRIAADIINAAGGIKSLDGARLEVVYADAESRPDVGAAQIDKLAGAGVSCIVGAQSSAITLATTQAAARFGIPHVVDIGTAPQLLQRGLSNVFRFTPGSGESVTLGVENLFSLNRAAGNPVKRIAIVHEDGPFGSGMAKTLAARLPGVVLEIVETISHPTPQRDFTTIALRLREARPDLIMPTQYINEFILFARALRQQRLSIRGIYSIFGGGASNPRFAREHKEAAQHIIDTNHWYDPRKPMSQALAQRCAAIGIDVSYDVMVAFGSMQVIADALEQAGSREREAVMATLARATFSDTIMPYGPIRFEKGQNSGARVVNTQIRDGVIELIYPAEFATATPVFPMPPRV